MATLNCTKMGFFTKHIYAGNYCPYACNLNRIYSSHTSLKDFGEYSESTYSVQTSDGEAISRLIAGYADIVTTQKSPSCDYEVTTDDLIMDQYIG